MGDSPKTDGDLPWKTDEEEAQPSAAELEAAGQSAMFGDPAPPAPGPVAAPLAEPPKPAAPAPAPGQPYRVLARKYRPQTFSELIGQDAMVQTLANAISRDRLAHAFLMTGVRGVGKTSTARLIAKALNCVGRDGQGGPTIDPCGQCEPCRAIAEGRHIDVIEMDAASHTGIDDVREIIEAVRYSSVSARFKMYIIDEAHMLSKQAWNGLLKTLEEPPPHVKFLFATTEVEKVPVTVLSRTQRFDLRRIPAPLLQQHFASVCRQEGVEIEDDALAMIAAAAEGSVRDGLSILDQAIAHADLDGQGRVTAERVRDMLGLADKGAQRRLFAALLEGDPQVLIAEVDNQYSLGVEPLALMRSLMDLAHKITLAQISHGADGAASQDERVALEGWAEGLTAAQLHRLWQLLLKGHSEVRKAPDPLVAAQMALLRVLHAATLPDPGDLVKRLEQMALTAPSANVAPAGTREGASATAAPVTRAADWAALIDQVRGAGQHLAASVMEMQVRVVELAPGKLRYQRPSGFADDIAPTLRDALLAATGQRWAVEELSREAKVDASSTVMELEQQEKQEAAERLLRDPLVEAAFAAFPDAEFVAEDESGGNRNWSRRA